MSVTAGIRPGDVDFRTAFEALPAFQLVLRPDAPTFSVVAATDAFCRAAGKARAELVGRGILDVYAAITPENTSAGVVSRLRESLHTVLHSRTRHRMDVLRYDTTRVDGSPDVRYWAPLNTPVLGDDDEVRFIIHAVENITDRVQQRHEAEAAERRIERLLDRISDAVFTIDRDWRYIALNPAARGMLQRAGANPETLLGEVMWNAFPMVVGTPFERGVREAAATGRAVHVEVSHPMPDGETLVVEGDAVPTGDGVAIYLRDVSEYHRLLSAEREARAAAESARLAAERARREADEANQAKSAFLATMSHEIRTPINAQIGYVQLLELGVAGPITPQQHDYLARVAATSEHLRGLVDDILDLAKIDAGRMAFSQQTGMTGALVAGALDLVRPQASARGVRLVDERAGEQGEPFVGDEHRVRQILANLLSNAVKFTDSGGVVSVGCGRSDSTPPDTSLHGEGPWTCIRVTDTGIGILPEEQTRIFDPFHQVDRGNTREHGGTGLGLAISRQLAALMGGDLTVESEPGEGSTFTIWLPAAGAAPEGADDSFESAAERGARARRQLDGQQVQGLADIGKYLRERLEEVLACYAARLRADPAFPGAVHLRRTELEDHQLSFLADLAQTLVVLEEADAPESDLLRDGSTIQRVVAELHGAMRQQRGWSEAQLEREYEILGEEIATVVRRCGHDDDDQVVLAMNVIGRLLDRALTNGLAALRRAAESATRPGQHSAGPD